MKVKVTRPDGTVIEADGEVLDLIVLLSDLKPPLLTLNPPVQIKLTDGLWDYPKYATNPEDLTPTVTWTHKLAITSEELEEQRKNRHLTTPIEDLPSF